MQFCLYFVEALARMQKESSSKKIAWSPKLVIFSHSLFSQSNLYTSNLQMLSICVQVLQTNQKFPHKDSTRNWGMICWHVLWSIDFSGNSFDTRGGTPELQLYKELFYFSIDIAMVRERVNSIKFILVVYDTINTEAGTKDGYPLLVSWPPKLPLPRSINSKTKVENNATYTCWFFRW